MSTNAATLTSSSKAVIENTVKSIEALVAEVRGNIGHVSEPKAQALLETTAEVLIGLKKAYQDYEGGEEKAWQ